MFWKLPDCKWKFQNRVILNLFLTDFFSNFGGLLVLKVVWHLEALVMIGVERIMMSRGFGISPYPTAVFMLANF